MEHYQSKFVSYGRTIICYNALAEHLKMSTVPCSFPRGSEFWTDPATLGTLAHF